MYSSIRFSLLTLICLFVVNPVYSKEYAPKIKANSEVLIEKEWNLNGKSVELPAGVTLNFSNNGRVSNGQIVGTDTRLKGRSVKVLDNVNIAGTWVVPEISSNMFVSLADDNALRNVFALTNPAVNNKVVVELGTYTIALNKSDKVGVVISSNTEVELKGIIKLKGNDLRACDMVRISGKNVKLFGGGLIIGDRNSHVDKGGEWGMGVNVDGSANVLVKGITISDCWGDCIYIGGKSKNVKVINTTLSGGRRQGISITSADDVLIENCHISDIEGTDPQFGIDIEPNKNECVSDVSIKGCIIKNCITAVGSNGRAHNSLIKNIKIDNCTIDGINGDYAIKLRLSNDVVVCNNKISCGLKCPILIVKVNMALVSNNNLSTINLKPIRFIECIDYKNIQN